MEVTERHQIVRVGRKPKLLAMARHRLCHESTVARKVVQVRYRQRLHVEFRGTQQPSSLQVSNRSGPRNEIVSCGRQQLKIELIFVAMSPV
jgi:hypothetical protein